MPSDIDIPKVQSVRHSGEFMLHIRPAMMKTGEREEPNRALERGIGYDARP